MNCISVETLQRFALCVDRQNKVVWLHIEVGVRRDVYRFAAAAEQMARMRTFFGTPKLFPMYRRPRCALFLGRQSSYRWPKCALSFGRQNSVCGGSLSRVVAACPGIHSAALGSSAQAVSLA